MMDASDPLAALRPLHVPPPVSWWPPAPGWWLAVALVATMIYLIYRHYTRMAPKYAALKELKLLKTKRNTTNQSIALLNQLLKRYALVCWPAETVAALSGQPWLDFLDAHGGNGQFSHGPGRILQSAPYQQQQADLDQLITLAHRWISVNTPTKKTHV
jgi:glutathione S-transferase